MNACPLCDSQRLILGSATHTAPVFRPKGLRLSPGGLKCTTCGHMKVHHSVVNV